MSRRKCVEQINHLERQQRLVAEAIRELRTMYTAMLPAEAAAMPSEIKAS